MILGNGKRHMSDKYVIFAPHIDDEVIGCFRLLESRVVSKVYYFYDITDARKSEAINCAAHYGFEPIFVGQVASSALNIPSDVIILAPNISDNHPHHKEINRLAKSLSNKKKYYSVDMVGRFDVLSLMEQARKKIALNNLFPSQQALFTNEKYYLFESLVEEDMLKMIWVTFQRKGFHRFDKAAISPTLQDVNYLSYKHRHLFKFKVSIEVSHSDREIEFHQFLNWLESLYDGTLELDFKSCEMLADELAFIIGKRYNKRKLIIEISEDGECGCTCEYMI
jgi:hypothetical protein